MRVLVVEDEVKMAGLLKRALEEEGYAVDVAGRGEDALWLGTENPYDAIILDVMIPAPDGFEVCRRLRAGTAGRPSSCSPPAMPSTTASGDSTRAPTTT